MAKDLHIPMIPYRNLSGRSGVVRYGFVNLTAKDQVMLIEFKDGSKYAYLDTYVGLDNFQRMRDLADRGEGLATFISKEKMRGLRLWQSGGNSHDDDGSG